MNLSQYEILIIPAGMIAIAIAIVLFLMLGLVVNAFGCSTDCDLMLLSDEWDNGYVFDIAKECLK